MLSTAWQPEASASAQLSLSGVMTSMTIRPEPRSPGRSDVRNDPNRGPRSRTMLASVAYPDVLNQIRSGHGRERRVERVSVELEDEAVSFLRDRVRRLRRHVEGQTHERAEVFHVSGDARHADVADEDQAGRLAKLERSPHGECQGARDEIDRDEPGSAIARGRRRQRDQPAADRSEALTRRQHDRLRARRDGQAAGEAVFADGELEELVEVVEREHLLATDEPGRESAPTLGG